MVLQQVLPAKTSILFNLCRVVTASVKVHILKCGLSYQTSDDVCAFDLYRASPMSICGNVDGVTSDYACACDLY